MPVVHCKREPHDVYIGRGSMWGNPFKIGVDGTREEVIEKFRHYAMANPNIRKNVGSLHGKTLGCWCSPKACHGDVLLEMAAVAAARPYNV